MVEVIARVSTIRHRAGLYREAGRERELAATERYGYGVENES